MLSRVKKQKENTELPRVCLSVLHFDLDQWTYQIYRKTSLTLNATSESVVKAGKVEISIKRGQKSELSIYDEAAGKSTKSQILSNALKRIEPRVWSLDDFEMGSPLGVSVEKTSKKIVVINVAISMTTKPNTSTLYPFFHWRKASSNTKTQPFRNRNNETVLNLRGDPIKENYLEEICLEAAL
ncbi:hypothetical protein RhiirA4_456934 [Rhizophagus irregularis]|uniref:Uncharacterized protein n=1 Tax=Rhizophagus irregularis TaxID=588596 RepID=A0A2I1G8Q7_9GLOM|nr:hypothetical protein RhiirA4_456934 [Rhizophagus irregularis]